MSETTVETAPVEDNATETPEMGDGGKRALQVERDARKQAEQQAKALQAQIDALNAEKMSDLEKAQAAAKAAAEEAATAKTEALRYRLAAKHGISEEDASLFLTGTDEASMQAQAERLAARNAQEPRNPAPDPTQGGAGGASPALNSDALTDSLRAAVGA